MRQSNEQNLDLISVGLLTLAVVVIALGFPDWHSPLRIVLALFFLLLVPGYVLSVALFPKRGDLEGVERLVLSLGLSVAVLPLLGLLLNYTPWGIRLAPMAVALACFIACAMIVVLLRRSRLAPDERFHIEPKSPTSQSYARLFLLVGLAFAVVIVSAQALRPAERVTEFYILGPEGRLEGYPTRLAPGETFTLTLGIGNHEGQAMAYRIHVPFDAERADIPPIWLEDGETREVTVELRAPEGEGRTRLSFELYRGTTGDQEPYRSLHLFVDLTSSQHGQPYFATLVRSTTLNRVEFLPLRTQRVTG